MFHRPRYSGLKGFGIPSAIPISEPPILYRPDDPGNNSYNPNSAGTLDLGKVDFKGFVVGFKLLVNYLFEKVTGPDLYKQFSATSFELVKPGTLRDSQAKDLASDKKYYLVTGARAINENEFYQRQFVLDEDQMRAAGLLDAKVQKSADGKMKVLGDKRISVETEGAYLPDDKIYPRAKSIQVENADPKYINQLNDILSKGAANAEPIISSFRNGSKPNFLSPSP